MFTDRTNILIGRMRVQDAGVDPLLTQLRTAYLLNSADLRPEALLPGAILCVRRLRDPLPGTLMVREAHARPARAWESAVRTALNDLLRRAARPIAGLPGANEESVLFADQAELLACLALDWLDGLLPAHWWWAQLLRRVEPRQAVVTAWLDAPEYLPAAMAQLQSRNKVVAFAAALSEPEAEDLLTRVIARFDLHHLAGLLPAFSASDPPPPAASATLNASPLPAPVPATPLSNPPDAPWLALVPPLAQGLSAGRQLLLGLGLTLTRQPQTARSAPFAQAVSHWLNPNRAAAPAHPPARPLPSLLGSSPSLALADSIMPIPAPPGPDDVAHPPAPDHAPALETPALHVQQNAAAHALPAQVDSVPALPVLERAAGPPPQAVAPAAGPPLPLGAPAADPHPSQPAETLGLEAAPLLEAEVDTMFGGLFYLINLGIRSGLYGDFTTPRSPGIDLSIWDFLALLGEAFLDTALHNDPVWALLARLSGREGRPPGADFAPPDEWRIPWQWLEPFTPGPCHWSHAADRLRIWMPAATGGFWLADVRAETDPAALLARLVEPEHGYTLQPGAVPTPRTGALERWVDWIAAYAQARLRLALDIAPEADFNTILLSHQGHIQLSAARLDLFLNLAELPVAIRLAGLDRNPGWVPAAGRWITFHFR